MYKEKNYGELFCNLKGIKKGKRCFIIGNGPSLNMQDLNKLRNEDCFATNEIHRVFSNTQWRPTYYILFDRYSKSTPEEIRDLECGNMFISDYYFYHNNVLRSDYICLHLHYRWNESDFKISEDISKKVIVAPTTSFGMMQIAAYLGYTQMYLLGFDHNYAFEFDEKGRVVTTKVENAHFYADDVPEDIIADVWGMTKAYESFAKYAKAHGITIKNATRGGKLEVFERVDLDSLFD